MTGLTVKKQAAKSLAFEKAREETPTSAAKLMETQARTFKKHKAFNLSLWEKDPKKEKELSDRELKEKAEQIEREMAERDRKSVE